MDTPGKVVYVYYRAPKHEFPEPAPSLAAIHASRRLSTKKTGDRDVTTVACNEHYVVKYGNISFYEARLLWHVRRKLPKDCFLAPKIYAFFKDPETKIRYLVVENIKGVKLSTIWGTLSDMEKASYAAKLADSIKKLRVIFAPPTPSRRDQEKVATRFYRLFAPPTDIEADFAQRLVHLFPPAYSKTQDMVGDLTQDALPAYSGRDQLCRPLLAVLESVPAVMTHGSLHFWNIIIRENGMPTLMSWDRAGWYPPCWEYVAAVEPWLVDWFRGSTSSWLSHLSMIIQPYPVECGILHESKKQKWERFGRYADDYWHR